jgi:hypothetical protein
MTPSHFVAGGQGRGVRPCEQEHDTTALRTHAEILPALAEAAGDLPSLGDLGCEGEADTITQSLDDKVNVALGSSE